MRPILISKQLATASANNCAAAQSPGVGVILLNGSVCTGNTTAGVCALQAPGAGAITINGSVATGGKAFLTIARKLFFLSSGNDSGITFSIGGVDVGGQPIGETITGGNTTSVNTVNKYLRVDTITHTGSVAANLTVGTQGEGTLDTQRIVIITSGGNDTGISFTLTGTDDNGRTITEAITGANAGAASSVLNYKTVTGITHTGTVATTVTLGTNGIGSTPPIPLDQHTDPFAVALFIEIATGATVNATVQYTPDDVFGATNALTTTGLLWTDHANLGGKTASADSNIAFPAAAVRLKVNSGTDAAKIIVRQAGLYG